MAIARGAGTEIIRSAHFEVVDSTVSKVIIGVQHHIYTVLSVICYASSVNSDGNYIQAKLVAYDAKEGTTDQGIEIFRQDMSNTETYVWNDKFSFNGYEPSGTAVLSAAVQILIAAQGGSVVQKLIFAQTNVADDYDITVTYLDQDWT